MRVASGSIISADKALAEAGILPLEFSPRDAMGLLNCTAASTALASLVLYNAHQLAVLSQVFTAMTVEGLTGSSESFHSFIQQVRPHPGQIEAARNILGFLR